MQGSPEAEGVSFEDLPEDIQKKLTAEPKRKPLCAGLRYDLKKCVLKTDCVKIDKRLPRDCLREQKVPPQCVILAREFMECKRQFIDMRKRFRGNRGY